MEPAESKMVKCKAWEQEGKLFFMSPKFRTLTIDLSALGLDTLQETESAAWEEIQTRANAAILERSQWEKSEKARLRKLADGKGKTWVYELEEYQDHVKVLQTIFPVGSGAVWVELSLEEMKLIAKISTL